MIRSYFEMVGGKLVGCSVIGHGGNNARSQQGKILCAAVSSAMQLTCNTLTECFHADVDIVNEPSEVESQNRLAIRMLHPDAVQSEILHGLLIHFQNLAEDFHGGISIEIVEGDES